MDESKNLTQKMTVPGPPDESAAQDQAGLTMEQLVVQLIAGGDPDIKFHITGHPEDAKARFVRWSQQLNAFESKVWKLLGGKNNPWMFIPQVEICGFVVDFFSPGHKVILEADGPDHNHSVAEDQQRDVALLTKKGFKTLRLTPLDLNTSTPQDLFRVIENFIDPENRVTPEIIMGVEGGSVK